MNYISRAGLKTSFPTISTEEKINIVFSLVCEYYKVPREDLISKSRKRKHVMPRYNAMYILRTKLKLHLTKIGNTFKRDHTSVIHAITQINNLVETDAPEKKDILAILELYDFRKSF